MRISDWSSDVCSSDLQHQYVSPVGAPLETVGRPRIETSDRRGGLRVIERRDPDVEDTVQRVEKGQLPAVGADLQFGIGGRSKKRVARPPQGPLGRIRPGDRKGVGAGKSVSVRVSHGGGRN